MTNEFLHLGVDKLLRRAASVLKEKSLAHGITYDPETGSVDLYGAILIAAGAKPNNLMTDSVHPSDVSLPAHTHAAVEAAFFLLDAVIGDIDDWNDSATTDDAINALLRCCNVAHQRLAIT